MDASAVAKSFSEALHPRVAAGSTGGGRFAAKEGQQEAKRLEEKTGDKKKGKVTRAELLKLRSEASRDAGGHTPEGWGKRPSPAKFPIAKWNALPDVRRLKLAREFKAAGGKMPVGRQIAEDGSILTPKKQPGNFSSSNGGVVAKSTPADKTPEPFSSSKTSNWVARQGGLPNYIQHVAHALTEKGMDESRAIATAINRMKMWAAGGGGISSAVQAAAAKAIAELKAKGAASKVSKAMDDVILKEMDHLLDVRPTGVLADVIPDRFSKARGFDPSQPRDNNGRWVTVGSLSPGSLFTEHAHGETLEVTGQANRSLGIVGVKPPESEHSRPLGRDTKVIPINPWMSGRKPISPGGYGTAEYERDKKRKIRDGERAGLFRDAANRALSPF